MSLNRYVRQLNPIQENNTDYVNRVKNLYEVNYLNAPELAKYGGIRARTLDKAIQDGTPLETTKGTFPLTWISDSDRDKFKTAIGKDNDDYNAVLKSRGRFKPIFKNKDEEEFKIKDIVKTKMFGGEGSSGQPKGADWEDIITHHYNNLIGYPGHDPKATKAVQEKWDDFDEIGQTIAKNFKSEGLTEPMIQYGAGKSKSNLSAFWQNPAKGVKGGTDGTPKTDMYTSNYQISLKKAGGSQLASGGQGETLATFYAALQHFSTISKEGKAVIDEVMKAIKDNFEKLSTNYSKGDLEKIAKDKKKQGKLADKDKTALEQYITTEQFHKDFNKEITPKLDEITDAKEFKEWFIFEAMSGYSKFKEKRAVASVCMEFSADNGKVTKFIEVAPNGLTKGLSKANISGKIKDIASGAKIYAAWKSSGGNPYSVLRVSSYGEDENFDEMTLRGCIRKTIHEDKISQAFLREEVGQLDEFKFIGRTFDRIKKMGKNAILWVKNLITKIMKAVTQALNKIKKMGKKIFEAIFKFVGLEATVGSTIPNEIKGFVTVV